MKRTNRLSLYIALVISVSVAVVCLALHECLPGLCLRVERARVERDVERVAALFTEAQRQLEALADQLASSDDIRDVFSRRSPVTSLRLSPPVGLKTHDLTHVVLLSPNRELIVGGRLGERMTSAETLDPELAQALRFHKDAIRSSAVPRGGIASASRTGKPTLIAVVPVTSPDARHPLGHVVLLRLVDDSLVKSIAFRTQVNYRVMTVADAIEHDPVVRANISKITFNKGLVLTETDEFVTGYGSIKDSQGTSNLVISAVLRRELSEAAAGLRRYLIIVLELSLGVAVVIAFTLTRLTSVGREVQGSGPSLSDDRVPLSGAVGADSLGPLNRVQHNPLAASVIPSDDRIDNLENAIACWWHDIAASSVLTNMWAAEDVLDIHDVYQRMGRSYRRLLVVLEAFNDSFAEQSDLVMDAYHARDREQLLFAMGASRGYLLDISARKAATLCSRIEALAHAHNLEEAVALVPSLAEQMRVLFCLISRILSSSATIVSPQEVGQSIEKASIP
jgi:sensor domain CHASE-containing protein